MGLLQPLRDIDLLRTSLHALAALFALSALYFSFKQVKAMR